MPALPIVAHRVLTWIEPFLYRTIALDGSARSARSEGFQMAIRSKWANVPSFLRDNVLNLLWNTPEYTTNTLYDILSVCTGTQILALLQYKDDAIVHDLEALNDLRTLTAKLGDQGIFDAVESMDLRNPMFSALTHLHLLNKLRFNELDH
ncbi:hypothetical protein DFH09DRAFT_198163 [Mycena vulgaris]|nr:hypothetical protein DFH09DRAFT_198163 [Mycena vulgaris]